MKIGSGLMMAKLTRREFIRALLLAIQCGGCGSTRTVTGPGRGAKPAPPDPKVPDLIFDPKASAGLFIGIQEFGDPTQPQFAKVPYAVDDAVDLAQLFIDLGMVIPNRVKPAWRLSRQDGCGALLCRTAASA